MNNYVDARTFKIQSNVTWANFIPKGFYKEVASPLLLEVNLHYPDSMENSVTTNHFRQFFDGSEIVVAGRLNDSQSDAFLVEVSAQMVRESKIFLEMKFTYDMEYLYYVI